MLKDTNGETATGWVTEIGKKNKLEAEKKGNEGRKRGGAKRRSSPKAISHRADVPLTA